MRILVGLLAVLLLVGPVHAQTEAPRISTPHAHRRGLAFKRAGMYLLGFGIGSLASGVLTAGGAFYVALDRLCIDVSGSCPANPADRMFAASGTLIVAGVVSLVTGIGLYMDGKKRLAELDAPNPYATARPVLEGFGVAPLLANGQAQGGIVQARVRF